MEKEREERIVSGEQNVPEVQLPTISYVRLLCSLLSLSAMCNQLIRRCGGGVTSTNADKS